MADTQPVVDPLDKLNTPPNKDGALKLTLNSIETKASKSLENVKKKSKRTFANLDELANTIGSTTKSDREMIDYLKDVLAELKETVEKTDTHLADTSKQFRKESAEQQEQDEKAFSDSLEEQQEEVDEAVQSNQSLQTHIHILIEHNNDKTQKSLPTSKSFFGKTWDYVKKHGTGLYSSAKSMSKAVGNGNFCSFFDKTIARTFRVFKERGGILGIFVGAASFVWTGLKLIANGVMWVIEKLYDGFVKLAKIGWAVISTIFNVISTPFISAGKWLVDALVEFISSPVGFVLTLGLFALGAYLFWKPAAKFIKEVASHAWKWVVDGVKGWLGEKNIEAIYGVYETGKDEVKKFFVGIWNYVTDKDGLAVFYDKTIGNSIGYTSAKIKDLWNQGIDFLSKGWDTFVSVFTNIKDENLLDELLITWATIKQIYLGSGAYRDSLNAEENTQRAYAGLSQNLEKQAEAYVQSRILDEVFGTYGGKITPENKNALIAAGQQALDTFIKNRKFSADERLNQRILSNVDVNVSSIIDTLSNKNIDTLTKLRTSVVDDFRTNEQLVDDLAKVVMSEDFKDVSKAGPIAGLLDRFLSQDDRKSAADQVADQAKQRKYIPQALVDFVSKQQLNLNTINGSSFNVIKGTDHTTGNEDIFYKLDMILYTIKSHGRSEALKDVANYMKSLNLSTIPSKDIKKVIDVLFTNAGKTTLNDDEFRNLNLVPEVKQASGGIIKGPVHALVGEAGYPEIVIPLNSDGMEFVYNSMKDFIIDNIPESKPNHKKSILRRLSRGATQKTDYKVFDMKNLSHGIVGVD